MPHNDPNQSPQSPAPGFRPSARQALAVIAASLAAGGSLSGQTSPEHTDHLPVEPGITQTVPEHLGQSALGQMGVTIEAAEPASSTVNHPPRTAHAKHKKHHAEHHATKKPAHHRKHHKPKHHHKHPKHHAGQRLPYVTPMLVPPLEKPVAPAEHLNLHPERLAVPENVSAFMRRDVTYIPATSCSGLLVRNASNEAIGVQTAEHCSLMPGSDHRQLVNGQTVARFNEPLNVQTGNVINDLHDVGEINSFVLNNPDDNTHDQAFGVFRGHSPDEILANNHQLSSEAISALQVGDVVYDSGWPVDQTENDGPLKRQEFAMSVLGTATWLVKNGKQLNLLLAAVPASKDGAECSWGNSGSVAFILGEDGQPQTIGSASAFTDFGYLYNAASPEQGQAVKQNYEDYFGVDLTGYSAICGFAYEAPSADSGMVVANVEVTGPRPPSPQEQAAAHLEEQLQADFFKPDYPRHIINGLVEVTTAKGEYWIDRPVFVYDDVNQVLVLAEHYSNKGAYNLAMEDFIGLNMIQQLAVYSRDSRQTAPDITTTSIGELQTDTDQSTNFTDQNGFSFGQLLYDQTPSGLVYHLGIDDNQLALHEPFNKGGADPNAPGDGQPAG